MDTVTKSYRGGKFRERNSRDREATEELVYNDLLQAFECSSCGARQKEMNGRGRYWSTIAHTSECLFENRGSASGNSRVHTNVVTGIPRRRVNNVLTISTRDSPHIAMHQRIESRGANEPPLLNPVYGNMRNSRVREETFHGRWPRGKTQCSVREIADAGFFYDGPYDEVLCWYCGGGLERWDYYDDPWFEHAKFHSECEFLINRKGSDFVDRVVRDTPYVTRPTVRRRSRQLPTTSRAQRFQNVSTPSFPFVNESYSTDLFHERNWERTDIDIAGVGTQTTYRAPGMEVTMTQRQPQSRINPRPTNSRRISYQSPRNDVERAMNTSVALEAMGMGFSSDIIRQAFSRHLRECGSMQDNVSDLINDIISIQENPLRSMEQETSILEEEEIMTPPVASPRQRDNNRRSTNEEIGSIHESAETRPLVTGLPAVQSGPESLFSSAAAASSHSPANTRGICHLCSERPVKILFLPCAHLITCRSCGLLLSQCPICSVDIENHIEVKTQ